MQPALYTALLSRSPHQGKRYFLHLSVRFLKSISIHFVHTSIVSVQEAIII